MTPLDAEAVKQAASRIEGLVERTPVISNLEIDQLLGCKVFFKGEHLQPSGAFKVRGATNMVFAQSASTLNAGVCTHSSGNHGAALARAAEHRGCSATIVMPMDASAVKRQRVLDFGGDLIECEKGQLAREATLREVQRRTGALFVPPFDHPLIIAGQGTAALELLEEVSGIKTIIAPVGGGGLISGTCIAARGIDPAIDVIAAEPLGADDAARSKAACKLLPQTGPNTIADGLLTGLGDLTWPYVRDQVSDVITVSEEEIISAMRLFWERAKIVIEPSSATAVAVALKTDWPSNSRIGIIVSGGNVDLAKLPWVCRNCPQ